MVKISPSILSADFSRLGEQIQEAERASADCIHIDVMDGHFVPNITIGPVVVQWIRKVTKLPFHTHLMIENPEKYIPRFIDAGSDLIIVHIETCPSLQAVLDLIKQKGAEAGICLNPGTPAEQIIPFLDKISQVLVMTVNPGFGAQAFMTDMLPKIERIGREKQGRSLAFDISVDGGIYPDTAPLVYRAGARILVAGNAVFGKGDAGENIRALRASCA
ncbi:MAG: ribulose-phosphate 3-epimerase [Candidatus Raymondbacteria bacterium RifOxyA12_full_50_37]|uniref:Ribulose-phosphate 3-epimerase n=1 Tax=Candidatus Raymondbacteria bacterium RIFOXYD12_FULL_49_13 TaxID=1817890 RepID=A0A1F7FD13_UNCRA|nr:MAG: ribulose-phosphate 3-epimerase [Candidatus Raymondbacteria bacterium RifOxyA12_full_50_37]OGJ93550.1 MAG: ribulose-phosphate 3-epimerase [Candidatus Raymondbacteria bacterium RIFOXYA2_FULL_49_16]OGJ98820.1 MAG: ribulose-phosphate 3-epimerase [Candidatus Raymondbacteria bacterium RIFOXYC2_FULL_50_21]OGK02445.1 MAG: ribulose-phosphate 3-epimerase [Candidatus Raymondbacteria bacterium RifOxyB12_full_50_8]OGK04564.1 MAG: ribulose-phosphate 3-epimerase [Candidatus Raymondbacteria bacterium R